MPLNDPFHGATILSCFPDHAGAVNPDGPSPDGIAVTLDPNGFALHLAPSPAKRQRSKWPRMPGPGLDACCVRLHDPWFRSVRRWWDREDPSHLNAWCPIGMGPDHVGLGPGADIPAGQPVVRWPWKRVQRRPWARGPQGPRSVGDQARPGCSQTVKAVDRRGLGYAVRIAATRRALTETRGHQRP
jgi:hypothetical protein